MGGESKDYVSRIVCVCATVDARRSKGLRSSIVRLRKREHRVRHKISERLQIC